MSKRESLKAHIKAMGRKSEVEREREVGEEGEGGGKGRREEGEGEGFLPNVRQQFLDSDNKISFLSVVVVRGRFDSIRFDSFQFCQIEARI